MWAVLSALYPANKNVERTAKYDSGKLNLDGLTFPVRPEDASSIRTFENNNNVSVNIYYYEDETVIPGAITTRKMDQHVNLLLISTNEGDYHYCWIKDMSRLLAGREGHRHKGKR